MLDCNTLGLMNNRILVKSYNSTYYNTYKFNVAILNFLLIVQKTAKKSSMAATIWKFFGHKLA